MSRKKLFLFPLSTITKESQQEINDIKYNGHPLFHTVNGDKESQDFKRIMRIDTDMNTRNTKCDAWKGNLT
jgi:hypothetical protein